MEEQIYNVLQEILEELKILNVKKKNKKTKKHLTDDERIDLFIDYIINLKNDGISKSDLRAAKIVSDLLFKHFWDENLQEIIRRTKEKHNILLSRRFQGYFLYKRVCRGDIGD